MKDIAGGIGVCHGTASVNLKWLLDEGWVQRAKADDALEPDMTERRGIARSFIYSLTPTGLDELKRLVGYDD